MPSKTFVSPGRCLSTVPASAKMVDLSHTMNSIVFAVKVAWTKCGGMPTTSFVFPGRRLFAVPASAKLVDLSHTMNSIVLAIKDAWIIGDTTRAHRFADLSSEVLRHGIYICTWRVFQVALCVFTAAASSLSLFFFASEMSLSNLSLSRASVMEQSTYSNASASEMEHLRLGPKRSVETNIHQNKIL